MLDEQAKAAVYEAKPQETGNVEEITLSGNCGTKELLAGLIWLMV